MLILTLRTDNPQSEIGIYDGQKQLAYETWKAHRQLAETLHQQIATKLQFVSKDWQDLEGIVVFQGPGSFTGLRIGIAVANALAYSLDVPIVATMHDDWIEAGTQCLLKGDSDKIALPEYGSLIHTTKPTK